jgi:outer membrane protein assembly factor BamB
MGDLLCLNSTNGDVLWKRSFLKEYAASNAPVWGWASHPILDGNKIISLVGGEGSAVVAFDADSGKEIWRALSTREIGYAPPVLHTAGGKRQLIVWHSEAISSLNPDNGEVYWTQPYPAEGKPQRPEVTVAMPRISGDDLFLTSFYHGALMLQLDRDKPAATILWNRHSASLSKFDVGLHTTMTTPLFKGGYVYGICAQGELRCLDAKTGDRKWETFAATDGKEGYFATVFFTEYRDRVFIWNDQGDLILAKLTPEKYEEISRARLLDRTENARGRDVVWSAPAFANRCFFARNLRELICVSLADSDPS